MGERKRVINILKVLLLVLAFFLATFRAIAFFGLRGVLCNSDWLTIITPCTWGNVSIELQLWILTVVLLVLILGLEHDFSGYFRTCKQNWLIFLFIIIAFVSLSWTIHFEITLYKSIILLFTSLIAIYFGHSFRLESILKILALYYIFICTLNLLFVYLFSPLGIMPDPFYKGGWQGIFWHRNYLGCFMALGVGLFLVNLLSSKKIGGGEFYLNLVMLALSSFLLVKSKSATGIITGLVLVGLVIILFAWVKWHHKLKPVHYYGFAVLAVAGMVLFFMNLDFIFGLLGRNTSLTGRIPMWEYLFQHLIIHRPWLGYGYGALFHMQGIIDGVANALHWPAPVVIGDNGFIDILLHLGIVGLIILLSLIVIGFVRGIKYFLLQRTLQSAFPIFVLVFAIVANITLSLILESETLLWMIALSVIISLSYRSHTDTMFDQNLEKKLE
jgi:exopolysaccharide production protein ExoQ